MSGAKKKNPVGRPPGRKINGSGVANEGVQNNRVGNKVLQVPDPVPQEPKRMHGRPPFSMQGKRSAEEDMSQAESGSMEGCVPKRGRGRPPKMKKTEAIEKESTSCGSVTFSNAPVPQEPKRMHGRPPFSIQRKRSAEEDTAAAREPVPPQPIQDVESRRMDSIIDAVAGNINGPVFLEQYSKVGGKRKRNWVASDGKESTFEGGVAAPNEIRRMLGQPRFSVQNVRMRAVQAGNQHLAQHPRIPENEKDPLMEAVVEGVARNNNRLVSSKDLWKGPTMKKGVREIYMMPRLHRAIEYVANGRHLRATTLHGARVRMLEGPVSFFKAEAERAHDHRRVHVKDFDKASLLLLTSEQWLSSVFWQMWNGSFDSSEDPRNAIRLDDPDFFTILPEANGEKQFLTMLKVAIGKNRYDRPKSEVVPNLPAVDFSIPPMNLSPRTMNHVLSSSAATGSFNGTGSSSGSSSASDTGVPSDSTVPQSDEPTDLQEPEILPAPQAQTEDNFTHADQQSAVLGTPDQSSEASEMDSESAEVGCSRDLALTSPIGPSRAQTNSASNTEMENREEDSVSQDQEDEDAENEDRNGDSGLPTPNFHDTEHSCLVSGLEHQDSGLQHGNQGPQDCFERAENHEGDSGSRGDSEAQDDQHREPEDHEEDAELQEEYEPQEIPQVFLEPDFDEVAYDHDYLSHEGYKIAAQRDNDIIFDDVYEPEV